MSLLGVRLLTSTFFPSVLDPCRHAILTRYCSYLRFLIGAGMLLLCDFYLWFLIRAGMLLLGVNSLTRAPSVLDW